MSATATQTRETDTTILIRLPCNHGGQLPPEMARDILDRDFSERDKARMHALAVRNQQGALSPKEKEVLLAFANAGTMLSILKSKARRTLNIKLKKPTMSVLAAG